MSTTNEQALNLKLQAISIKMQREVKRNLAWGRFMGNISNTPANANDPKGNYAGKPIMVLDEIKKSMMGNSAKIPLTLELAGPATYGSTALVGREEPMVRKWAEVYVNTVRHGVIIEDGSMETFNERAFDAAVMAVPLETWWHANMENWQIVTGIYEGLSENLTMAKADPTYGDGRGIAKRYHPNLYRWTGSAANSGSLSKVGTAEKFPTATDVYNAAAGNNKLPMSTYTVKAARVLVRKRGLAPIVIDKGFSFYPWWITPEQAASLRSDATFIATANSGNWLNIKDHPLVHGAIGYYEGFLFFEDVNGNAVRGFSGTSGSDLNILGSTEMKWQGSEKQNPRFLPQSGLIGDSGAYNQVGIIFGDNFLGKALGTDPVFKYREEDYDEMKGLACRAIYGYGRLDYMPDDQLSNLLSSPTSITGVYNRSSMLVMTYENIQVS